MVKHLDFGLACLQTLIQAFQTSYTYFRFFTWKHTCWTDRNVTHLYIQAIKVFTKFVETPMQQRKPTGELKSKVFSLFRTQILRCWDILSTYFDLLVALTQRFSKLSFSDHLMHKRVADQQRPSTPPTVPVHVYLIHSFEKATHNIIMV